MQVMINLVNDLQKRYHYNNISYKDKHIFMAAKVHTLRMEALKTQMEEEYNDLLRLVDLTYTGVMLVEQEFLAQREGEKIETFVQRISRLN